MRSNTKFKILLEALDNSDLFSLGHLLTALFVSDGHGFLRYTEVVIIALFFTFHH